MKNALKHQSNKGSYCKSNINIRKMEIKDTDEVVNLISSLAPYVDSKKENSIYEKNERKYFIENKVFVEKPEIQVIVADVSGIIYGYLAFYKNYSLISSTVVIFIENLYVDPKMRGLGIGKMLTEKIIEISFKYDSSRIELNADESNIMAERFYQRNGFKKTGESVWRKIL